MNQINQKKIVVVEDERIIAMDIRSSLLAMGYEVPALAGTGDKAIEKVEEFQPDLVLMDIMLNGRMDGLEAAQIIRNNFHIPVVYLTAHTDASTLERAKETGPFGYIVKPFEERDLHTTIEIAFARSKAENEVRKALEKERELSELKSRFVSLVSHEFRTPLSTILFSACLLEDYGYNWSEERKKVHLNRIKAGVERMNQLLEEILFIGKSDAGKLEFKPVPLDVEKFCREITEEYRETFGNQHHLQFISDRWQLTTACMDEKLLGHILSNLLSNAIKYSPAGCPIEFELSCQDDRACFRIQDRGIGIPSADRQHLFEMFHRATNVGTIPGTGLGLAIVKRSVDLHGGQIAVESQEGVGTTFRVALPLDRSARVNGKK